jgi:hypothetical protein
MSGYFWGGFAMGLLVTLLCCTGIVMAYERSWEAPIQYWLTLFGRKEERETE